MSSWGNDVSVDVVFASMAPFASSMMLTRPVEPISEAWVRKCGCSCRVGGYMGVSKIEGWPNIESNLL